MVSILVHSTLNELWFRGDSSVSGSWPFRLCLFCMIELWLAFVNGIFLSQRCKFHIRVIPVFNVEPPECLKTTRWASSTDFCPCPMCWDISLSWFYYVQEMILKVFRIWPWGTLFWICFTFFLWITACLYFWETASVRSPFCTQSSCFFLAPVIFLAFCFVVFPHNISEMHSFHQTQTNNSSHVFNIWYVFYLLLWIKKVFMIFSVTAFYFYLHFAQHPNFCHCCCT